RSASTSRPTPLLASLGARRRLASTSRAVRAKPTGRRRAGSESPATRGGDSALALRGGGRRGRGVGRVVDVDALLELLARFEERHPLRHHRHHLAGLRVEPLARVAALDDEAAEAADLDALAARQRFGEAREHRVHQRFGLTPRDAGPGIDDRLDQLALRHGISRWTTLLHALA